MTASLCESFRLLTPAAGVCRSQGLHLIPKTWVTLSAYIWIYRRFDPTFVLIKEPQIVLHKADQPYLGADLGYAHVLTESTIIDSIFASGLLNSDDADSARLADNATKLRRPLKSLNQVLENREYVAADRFTIGDLNAVSIVSWLTLTGFDFTGLEKVKAWIDRCSARPKFPKRG